LTLRRKETPGADRAFLFTGVSFASVSFAGVSFAGVSFAGVSFAGVSFAIKSRTPNGSSQPASPDRIFGSNRRIESIESSDRIFGSNLRTESSDRIEPKKLYCLL